VRVVTDLNGQVRRHVTHAGHRPPGLFRCGPSHRHQIDALDRITKPHTTL